MTRESVRVGPQSVRGSRSIFLLLVSDHELLIK